MKVFKPPHAVRNDQMEGTTVFLAGSIEMGKALPWADKVAERFKDRKVTFFNPRRDDWDSSWDQSIHNEEFKSQVTWELTSIRKADVVAFFIQGDTKSPISLLELGHVGMANVYGATGVIVCCEKGFWRRGNVEVYCDMFKIPLVSTFEELINELDAII